MKPIIEDVEGAITILRVIDIEQFDAVTIRDLADCLERCRSALIAAEGRWREVKDEPPEAGQYVEAMWLDANNNLSNLCEGRAYKSGRYWEVVHDEFRDIISLWRPAKAEGVE